jgi:predicted TIM-barrel fold metal-dependent hydrolase
VSEQAPSTTAAPRRSRKAGAVIDTDIHNYLAAPADIRPYLSARWARHHEEFGMRTPNSIAFFPTRPRKMAARSDTWPTAGVPGSDLQLMREQHLDLYNVAYGVLNPIDQILMGVQFPEYAAALTTGLNDFTLERWVEPEPRLYGSICIPYEEPRLAVREIHRLGDNPRFVQVLMNLRTREPFGSRKYWPIYEAALEHGLPIAVHVAGFGGTPLTGAGFPSYYFEDHSGYPQAFQAHVISLVCEGVFEQFPDLTWVCQEGGFDWVPWLGWRLDRAWRLLRDEVPHLTEPPSTYIQRHLWYTTQPIVEPERPGQLAEVFAFLDELGIIERILFSSDYPHWDFDAPDRALPRELSAEVRRGVLFDHAADLYGFAHVA